MSRLFFKHRSKRFHRKEKEKEKEKEVVVGIPEEIKKIEEIGIKELHHDIRDGVHYLTKDNYLQMAWYFTGVLNTSHMACIEKEKLNNIDGCLVKFDENSNGVLLNEKFNYLNKAFEHSESWASAAIFEVVQTLIAAANIKHGDSSSLRYKIKIEKLSRTSKKISILGINCNHMTAFRSKIINTPSKNDKHRYTSKLKLLSDGCMRNALLHSKVPLFRFTQDISNVCMQYTDYNESSIFKQHGVSI